MGTRRNDYRLGVTQASLLFTSLCSSRYAMQTEGQFKEIEGPGNFEWRYSRSPSTLLRFDADLLRYEMRRECHEILPGLLLGPLQVSKSLETLTSLRITHMYVLRGC